MTSVFLIFVTLLIIFCFKGPSKIQRLISNIIQTMLRNQKNINKNELGKNKRKSVKPSKTSIKKKHEPPKKSGKNNKKEKASKQKDNKSTRLSKNKTNKAGNIIQRNIIFNVNMIKSPKKALKFSSRKKLNLLDNKNSLKKSTSKQIENSMEVLNKSKRKYMKIKSQKFEAFRKIKNKEINNNLNKNNNDIRYLSLNDYELNNLEYDLAIELDKRTYFQYYWPLLKKKQLILFAFIPNDDYNLMTIKITLFLI